MTAMHVGFFQVCPVVRQKNRPHVLILRSFAVGDCDCDGNFRNDPKNRFDKMGAGDSKI